MINDRELHWLLRDKYHGQPFGSAQGELRSDILNDISRIENGEPIDYVIGFSRFLGCDIDLSFRPFIPRPETEFWVEKAIESFGALRHGSGQAAQDKQLRCLDMCAGSGCIGIAVLKNTEARVDFAEINENFCKQIALNCKKNNIEQNRFSVLHSNLFKKVNGQYDFILSNPPYVATSMPDRVEQSVKDFEPAGALWSGEDGLSDIKKLLAEALGHLNKGGVLYMEFGERQKDAIEKIVKALPYTSRRFFKDQYGRWRYLVVEN